MRPSKKSEKTTNKMSSQPLLISFSSSPTRKKIEGGFFRFFVVFSGSNVFIYTSTLGQAFVPAAVTFSIACCSFSQIDANNCCLKKFPNDFMLS
jgi:hypothetical protein